MSVVTVGGPKQAAANMLQSAKKTASRMACGDDRYADLDDLAVIRGRDLSEGDWQNQRAKIKKKGGMCATNRLNGLEKMHTKGVNPTPQELRNEEQRIRNGGADE